MALETKESQIAKRKNKIEQLLVFGYSCKLFRDDEKARFVDQNKHLIPHMGDETLKIDRYDARATLSDLRFIETPSGGYDRFSGFTDSEKHVELLCDAERYRALTTNEDEENMYLEEELKRVGSSNGVSGKAYGEVGYSYSREEKEEEPEEAKPVVLEEEKPFVPSPLLDIPLNMALPPSMKQNAVIEKTAAFICSQGPQMEILLKMKQAGNPMFDFLSFENALHGYYRLVLQSIKTGRYRPQSEQLSEESEGDEDDDEHYLHPSLIPKSKVTAAPSIPSIPSINYKPSENCAYSMLVNKLKEKTVGNLLARESSGVQNMEIDNGDNSNVSQSGDNSGTSTPVTGSNIISEALVEVESPVTQLEERNDEPTEEKVVTEDSSKSEQVACTMPIIVMPPSELQIIIDKMASYSAKNGRDFETIVKNKNDARFEFLDPNHVHHGYYKAKVDLYTQLELSKKTKIEEQEDIKKSDENSVEAGGSPQERQAEEEKSRIKLAPVCFSIKPKEVESVIIEKSALPMEDSSDEEEGKKPEVKQEGELKLAEVAKATAPVYVDLAASEEKIEKSRKIREAEKKKDRLTAAVRGRVASIAKEKHIQLERKKKVAAFLKILHVPAHNEESQPAKSVEDSGSEVASIPDPSDFPPERHLFVDLDDEKSSDSGKSDDSSSGSENSSKRRHKSRSSKKKSKKAKKRKHKSKSHKKHSPSKRHKKHHRKSE